MKVKVDKARIRAVQAQEIKVREALDALEAARTIPLDGPLHITTYRATTITGKDGKTIWSWPLFGVVVQPLKITKCALSCRILAEEANGYNSERLREAVERQRPLLASVQFKNIKSWKRFEKSEAGLYVSWGYLTPEFKEMAFGSPV